jgi:DNA polymerase-3 subunit beta
MNIKIAREILLKPLSEVSGIVERKHTLPILSNILLETKNNSLTLTATDLEIQISSQIESSNSSNFSITVSARKLLDICRSLPDGAELDLAGTESRLTVKAGKSKFNLQALPSADFPLINKADNLGNRLVIEQGKFKALLKQVEFAMAQQDIRYYLNGLLLEIKEGKLNLVGTDGHRLSFTSTKTNSSISNQEVILPRKTVIELIKLLEDSDDELAIEFASNQVSFEFAGIKIISKIIDGKFPDYTRVIPVGHQNTFETNRLGLLLAMQRASILSNEKYRGIRMVLSQNNLKLISTNSEQEDAEEEVELNYAGDSLDIGFNVTYLIEVLNNSQQDNVVFSFADANSSGLITIPGMEDYKYVVMPMRI